MLFKRSIKSFLIDVRLSKTFFSMIEPTIIRPIAPSDNLAVATIIRTVMTEFGAVGAGYSINDPEVDHMFEAFDNDQSAFFVVESEGMVLGCGGIAPLVGAHHLICELQKMYFLQALRGKGLGKQFLSHCLEAAKTIGYQECYLETIPRMKAANKLYQQFGFEKLCSPKGKTGHNSCDSYYSLQLNEEIQIAQG